MQRPLVTYGVSLNKTIASILMALTSMKRGVDLLFVGTLLVKHTVGTKLSSKNYIEENAEHMLGIQVLPILRDGMLTSMMVMRYYLRVSHIKGVIHQRES